MKAILLLALPALLLSGGCSSDVGQRVLPDQALATLAHPAANTTALHVTLLDAPQQGRLRLWLLNAQAGPAGRLVPGTRQLAPAVEYTPAQLRAHGAGPLRVPIPAGLASTTGLFLVAECHPSQLGDRPVAITVANRGTADPLTQVVLTSDSAEAAGLGSSRIIRSSNYPSLAAQPAPYGLTYVRLHPTAEWKTAAPQPFSVRVEAESVPR